LSVKQVYFYIRRGFYLKSILRKHVYLTPYTC